MEGIVIREMLHDDLLPVHALEGQCFTTPWELRSFEYEISNKDAILKVAVFHNQIVGYVCIRSMLDVTHILDLAVILKFRRMGIGSMLLEEVLKELKGLKPDTRRVILEVRDSNTAAIKLYEKFGFEEIGRRKGYYQKPHEDAIIMGLNM